MRYGPRPPSRLVLVSLSLLGILSGPRGTSGATAAEVVAPAGVSRSPAPVAFPLPLATGGEGAPRAEPAAVVPPLTGATPPAPVTAEETVRRSEALVRSAAPLEYEWPSRAAALGAGLEPPFAFVRDRIRFEAYPGVLRGAEGAYTARAGNACDRSVLLASMLRTKGIPTRFARGRLDRGSAEKLYERMFEAPTRGREDSGAPVAAPGASSGSTLERMKARATRDYATLRAALGSGGPTLEEPSRDRVLEEIEDHVWVEARVDGKWIDLDTSFPDAAVGASYCRAAQTHDDLPRDLHQRVRIRVTEERIEGTALKTATALEFEEAADRLIDRQIFLLHVPGGKGGPDAAIESALRTAGGSEVWRPLLWVDGNGTVGKPIAFRDEPRGPAERGKPPSGGLGGLFGRGGALSSGGSQFVAEWLEIETSLAGEGSETARRALVDRGGAAWRRAGRPDPARLRPLLRDENGPTSPREIHNIWLTAGRHDLASYALCVRLLEGLDRTLPGGEALPDLPFGRQVWPFAIQNFALLVVSDHLIVPSLDDRPDIRFYADSPRIFIVSAGLDPRGGKEGAYLQHDLRRDHLRVVLRGPEAAGAAVDRKLWFGVLEGAMEHELAVEDALGIGHNASAVTSTSALLDPKGVVVLRPGEPLERDRTPADPDAAALAAGALARGATLVIPRRALTEDVTGWWEIGGDSADARAVLGSDLNATRVQIPRIPRYGYDKPHVPSGGQGRTFRAPESAGTLGDSGRAAREAADREWFERVQREARELREAMEQKTTSYRSPLEPAEEEAAEKKGAAPEYLATIREIAVSIIGVGAMVLVQIGMTYGPQLLADYLAEHVKAALDADSRGGP